MLAALAPPADWSRRWSCSNDTTLRTLQPSDVACAVVSALSPLGGRVSASPDIPALCPVNLGSASQDARSAREDSSRNTESGCSVAAGRCTAADASWTHPRATTSSSAALGRHASSCPDDALLSAPSQSPEPAGCLRSCFFHIFTPVADAGSAAGGERGRPWGKGGPLR